MSGALLICDTSVRIPAQNHSPSIFQGDPSSRGANQRAGHSNKRPQSGCLPLNMLCLRVFFLSQAKVQDIKRPHAVVFNIITTSTTWISFRLLKKNLKNVWTTNYRGLILQRCPPRSDAKITTFSNVVPAWGSAQSVGYMSKVAVKLAGAEIIWFIFFSLLWGESQHWNNF